ncbi:MAG TPA: adenylate/guanylate cyclase domain-containing protein, partial [Aeromicrobium sp.]|nr:adenylate/guanylate cyclase domain-containing protein [Aeromicrobium sp.]
MINRLVRWLYARLGVRYWFVVLIGQVGAAVGVVLVTIAVIASYFREPVAQVAVLAAIAALFAATAVAASLWRSRDAIRLVEHWKAMPHPPLEATVTAWHAVTSLAFRQYRGNAFRVSVVSIIPVVAITSLVFRTGWLGFLALVLASVIPAAYGAFLTYSVAEFLAKPVVEELAARMPDDFPFTREGLPVELRMRLGLPVYTIGTGLLVASIIGDRDGARGLLTATLVAAAVGMFLSTELTVLLSRAVTTPIADVRNAMLRVRSGDYATRVAVTSSDELGELAHDFNLMAKGLSEREEMRAAFGTYVDREVVDIILSGEFPDSGVEADISILFCDIRGFTSYAETAAATDVVTTLNQMFTAIVPVIEKHGGHVDKFLGDGLLAYFGVPELHPDHADRALAAAQELVDAAAMVGTGLTVAAGVNTGRVLAGAVGGAGRLNFSVIGDAVNVAARVESLTRKTGDSVLITSATRDALVRPVPL